MIEVLFVISAVCVIMFAIKVVSVCCGNSMDVPAPVLHIFDTNYSNCYLYTFGIAFQVWFWANHCGLF